MNFHYSHCPRAEKSFPSLNFGMITAFLAELSPKKLETVPSIVVGRINERNVAIVFLLLSILGLGVLVTFE